MRRDMDLLRELMLKLEAMDVPAGGYAFFDADDEEIVVEGKTREEVEGHLFMIYDAGWAKGERFQSGEWRFHRLTPEGHDFVDTVRSPEVWTKTKAGASKVGGWTASLVLEVGKAYLKHLAKERLGLDL